MGSLRPGTRTGMRSLISALNPQTRKTHVRSVHGTNQVMSSIEVGEGWRLKLLLTCLFLAYVNNTDNNNGGNATYF